MAYKLEMLFAKLKVTARNVLKTFSISMQCSSLVGDSFVCAKSIN